MCLEAPLSLATMFSPEGNKRMSYYNKMGKNMPWFTSERNWEASCVWNLQLIFGAWNLQPIFGVCRVMLIGIGKEGLG